MTDALGSILLFLILLAIPGFLIYRSLYAPAILLRDGEQLLLKSKATLSIDRLMLAGMGSIYLTDQRLIWRPSSPRLGFLSPAPDPQDIRLTDITNAHALSRKEMKRVGIVDAFLHPQAFLRASKLEVEALGHVLFIGLVDWNPFRGVGGPELWMAAILTARTAPAAQRFMLESSFQPSPSKSMTIGTLLTFAVAGAVAIFGVITVLGALVDGNLAMFAVGIFVVGTQVAVIAYHIQGTRRIHTPRTPED